jgi:hypothetical protein
LVASILVASILVASILVASILVASILILDGKLIGVDCKIGLRLNVSLGVQEEVRGQQDQRHVLAR